MHPPFLFADFAVNAPVGISLVAVAVALAGQITMWITLKSPQKREVKMIEDLVNKDEFLRHVTENNHAHNQLFEKIGSSERRAAAEMKEYEAKADASRETMHREISEIRENVAGLEVKTESIDTQVGTIAKSVDALPDRILKMLSNIKDLGRGRVH